MIYAVAGLLARVTVSARACTIAEFSSENLLSPDQTTVEIAFQQAKAFAAGLFPTQPIFTARDPQLVTGLDQPIDFSGFGYAVVHYAPGSTGNPILNRGGSFDFYFIQGGSSCLFTFPQTGSGASFSNGLITSITLFSAKPVAEAGGTAAIFTIALSGLALVRRFRGFYQQQISSFQRAENPLNSGMFR